MIKLLLVGNCKWVNANFFVCFLSNQGKLYAKPLNLSTHKETFLKTNANQLGSFQGEFQTT